VELGEDGEDGLFFHNGPTQRVEADPFAPDIVVQPSSNGLRPTTEPGTQTSLRFSTELAVEVCYNTAEDESVRVATIFQQRVRVGSYVSLPSHCLLFLGTFSS
jgi:hypothetical protein